MLRCEKAHCDWLLQLFRSYSIYIACQQYFNTFLLMDIPIETRNLIVEHYLDGTTSRDVADMFGISKSAVNYILQRFRTSGSILPRRSGRCGRPRLLSRGDERVLRRASVINPTFTAHELRTDVGGDVAQVSVRTVQRSLNRSGRFAWRPRKSPALTPSQMKVRLQWCQKYRPYTREQWQMVR
jgi:transposase